MGLWLSARHLECISGTPAFIAAFKRVFSAFLSFPGSSQPIHLLSASENGNWLAAAHTDGQIHVFNLHKLKVSSYLFVRCGMSYQTSSAKLSCCFQLHCTLPVYSSCPTAIAIHPTTGHLLSAHADQQVSAAAPLLSSESQTVVCSCCASVAADL